MTLEFPKFLRRFNLKLLGVAHDDIVPGAVLSRKRGYLYLGHLSQLLPDQPRRFWTTEINPANIVYGSIQHSFKLGGGPSLARMGVRIDGGLRRAKSVDFSIRAVHARTFKNGSGRASMFSLAPLVHGLRQRSRASWKQVNNNWIVLETYYASEATVTFKSDGDVDLKTEIEHAGGVSVQGNASVRWSGKRSFKVTENDSVPFAFRGWKV